MRRHLLFTLVAGALLVSGLASTLAAPDENVLTTQEEANPNGGRRIRVSTPTVRISDFEGSFTLRLDCMHPVNARQAPDQCVINIVHRDIEAKYSLQRNVRFRVSLDDKLAFDGKLSNLGTHKEGPEVVEPLIGVWDYSLVKNLAASQKAAFLLEVVPPSPGSVPPRPDKVSVDESCIGVLKQMVDYFKEGPPPMPIPVPKHP
ncbi:MAG TPA: hypothetical protein VFW45_11685 [Candidatus Polarisedimenticolia bacterium]|nr:hypothetical protein [Candidatus Polarisedimenticolia bacterium]